MTAEEIYEQSLDKLNTWLAEHHKYNSPERTTILEIICHLKNPFTMVEVIEEAKSRNISRATVYNSMPIFEKAEILHCLKQQYGQRRNQYEILLRGSNIMQLICLRCGRVAEFKEVAITNIAMQRKYNNFRPQHMSMYVYGTCKFCRRIKAKGGDGNNN